MFYKFIKAIVGAFLFLIFRVHTIGKDNVPKNKPCIICPNHVANFDALIVAITTKEQVHFMGKKELFDIPLLGLLLRGLGAYSVDREGKDLKSYRKTLEFLKENKKVGIFFQGTRIKSDDLKASKNGVVLFALKSKVPIIPTAIKATYKPFSKVHVVYGEPIYLEEYYGKRVNSETLTLITNKISSKIEEMLSNI